MRGSNSSLLHTTETGCRWLYGNISHIALPNPNVNVCLPGTSQDKKNKLSLCRDLAVGERTRKPEARVENRLQRRKLIAGARCRNGPLQPFGALITRGGGGGASASATSGNTEEPPQTGYDSITWRYDGQVISENQEMNDTPAHASDVANCRA